MYGTSNATKIERSFRFPIFDYRIILFFDYRFFAFRLPIPDFRFGYTLINAKVSTVCMRELYYTTRCPLSSHRLDPRLDLQSPVNAMAGEGEGDMEGLEAFLSFAEQGCVKWEFAETDRTYIPNIENRIR